MILYFVGWLMGGYTHIFITNVYAAFNSTVGARCRCQIPSLCLIVFLRYLASHIIPLAGDIEGILKDQIT